MRRRVSIFASFLLAILFFIGCSTVKIPIAVTHPAEINMTQYKQIAIADISGNMGRQFGDGVKNNLIDGGTLKVVDRNRMDQIMKELNLSQSDLADSQNRVKLGKLMSASAMIAGHVNGDYKEETSSESRTCGSRKKEYPCTAYYRKGKYLTNGSIDVIDVQTGEIIKSKVLNSTFTDSTSEIDGTPAAINKEALAGSCLDRDLKSFLKAISPWTETVEVPFSTDGDIPDLEKGITQAKMGDMQEAIKIFATAAKTSEGNSKIGAKSIAKAYWDIGLAYEYSWEFDKAIEAFKKAYSIYANDDYLAEKKNAERLRTEREKLVQQTAKEM